MTRAAGSPRRWSPVDRNPFALEYLDEPDQLSRIALTPDRPVFLEDKSRRTFEWPLAQQRRQHVHSRIDAAELPVTHVTRRQGRPYTFVLSKTDVLLAHEQEARARDETDLEWLTVQWDPGA
jgi:hypothetical protein